MKRDQILMISSEPLDLAIVKMGISQLAANKCHLLHSIYSISDLIFHHMNLSAFSCKHGFSINH